MNWREYCKSIEMTDDQIKTFEAWPAELLTKAFEKPIADLAAAQSARDEAVAAKEANEKWYNETALPKISQTYQDAINWRTKAEAYKARLDAAKEYGFLGEDVVPGSPANPNPTNPNPNPNPGSGGVPGSPDLSGYVKADEFNRVADSIPDMLARLTNISNEHHSLFGSPLLGMDEMLSEAKRTKKNVREIWESKYKVADKRAELEAAKQAAHDKQIADAAVQKYASEHGHPFTAPNRPSIASKFTSQGSADSRHPWKGQTERKQERAQKFVQAMQSAGTA